MISLQDIVECISSTFILHKELKINSKFKVYKTFSYNLYSVLDKDTSLLHWETTKQCTDIEDTWNKLDKEFLKILITFIRKNYGI